MFQLQFFFAPLWRMGPRCSSAETQVCHRSYIIAARYRPTLKPLSNDYNAPIPKYTIIWDWIIYVICSLCLNNEIIIEIKLILLLKKSEENKCHYNKHMNLQPAPKQFLKQYICDCVKISRFFCWLCSSYILHEIVKLLLNNTFIYLRFFYRGSVSKTFSYTLK